MSKATYPVTVELSEELIELLAEHGDDLVSALKKLARQAKKTRHTIEPRQREAKLAREKRLTDRRAEVLAVGRLAHRYLRRWLEALPDNIARHERAAHRRALISEVAYELGAQPAYVELAIRRHRSAFQARLKARRERLVLRLAIQGAANRDIAACLRIGRSTVDRVLRELKVRARSEGVSLFELEHRHTVKQQIARAAETDDTVIRWDKIRAASRGAR